jgi:hypothetical protein
MYLNVAVTIVAGVTECRFRWIERGSLGYVLIDLGLVVAIVRASLFMPLSAS